MDALQGLGKVGTKFVLLLDVDQMLAAPDLLAAGALVAGTAEARQFHCAPEGGRIPASPRGRAYAMS